MKIKNSLIILFIFFSATLSAQSKKELDLRIDTLQTALNNEKQVVQNFTLQIQNLTTELEKMNKMMFLLTSQVVKQDSINALISNETQKLKQKTADIQKLQDSLKNNELAKSKEVITPKANLKMRLFSKYVNEKGKLFITEMSKRSAPDNYYFLCYDSSEELEKIQIEGIGENISITIKDMSIDEGKLIYDKPNLKIDGKFVIPNKEIKTDMGFQIVITIKQGDTIIIQETIQSGGCH